MSVRPLIPKANPTRAMDSPPNRCSCVGVPPATRSRRRQVDEVVQWLQYGRHGTACATCRLCCRKSATRVVPQQCRGTDCSHSHPRSGWHMMASAGTVHYCTACSLPHYWPLSSSSSYKAARQKWLTVVLALKVIQLEKDTIEFIQGNQMWNRNGAGIEKVTTIERKREK
jgi:hypothetical protein